MVLPDTAVPVASPRNTSSPSREEPIEQTIVCFYYISTTKSILDRNPYQVDRFVGRSGKNDFGNTSFCAIGYPRVVVFGSNSGYGIQG